MLGENWCWSPLGLKGLSDIYKDSSIALQCKGFALVDLPEATRNQSWIKMNAGQTGFYRVNYDENNWRKLADQLNTDHKVNNISCPLYLNRDLRQPPRRRQRQRKRQKSNIGLINKTTRHVHHSFVYISLPSLHDYDVKHFLVEEKPTYNAFLSNSKRVAESTYERYPSSTDIECIVTLFVLEIHCSWPRRIVGGCPEPCTASLLSLFLSWPRVELSLWNSSFNAPIKLMR